jgi:hypothetical protein
MEWFRDNTGRFQKRPHYSPEELDDLCEQIITEFLSKKYGHVAFPVSTNDLTILLERDAGNLDLYADLSDEEGEIEGVTEFRLGKKPVVRIAARLSITHNFENRLRTTLTHEYGHVRLHNMLYQVESKPASLFESPGSETQEAPQAHRCKRDSIISLSKRDWMEWQAGYVCGALLIPLNPLVECVKRFRAECGSKHAGISEQSQEGEDLITRVAKSFRTSRDAARVRLLQKSVLRSGAWESLF